MPGMGLDAGHTARNRQASSWTLPSRSFVRKANLVQSIHSIFYD